jgi:hypothetical protein
MTVMRIANGDISPTSKKAGGLVLLMIQADNELWKGKRYCAKY